MRLRSWSAALGLAIALTSGCGGAEDVPSGPRVDLIDDAIAAVEAHYGSPQEYFEISAGLDDVSVIVAVLPAGIEGNAPAGGTEV